MIYKRVHGDTIIKRRELEIDNYKKAKPFLIEDFHNLCGYCGKNFDVTLTDSQIEHFIPKKKYPQFKHSYKNLILCCPTCNNKKHEDWPSNDASLNITLNGKQGYVDPATDDYDRNIVRTEDGRIVGITDVGNYMVERLDFKNRPIQECFRAQELSLLIDVFKKNNKKNKKLAELFLELDDIRHSLFLRKER